MKSKVLFILHFSPAIHGSAIVGKNIKDSVLINSAFDCKYINLGTSNKLTDIGKMETNKLFRYLSILNQVLKHLVSWSPDLVYITITAKGPAFYKDSIVVALVKLFKRKIVYHFHNKGVYTRQNKLFDNLLYKFVFKNTQVILLSKYLYTDVQKYVPENLVHYCSNGILDKQRGQKEKKRKPEILFLSNLFKTKGILILLEACKILVNKGLDFHCTVVGRWGDITEQQFHSKLKEESLFTYVSHLTAENDIVKEKIMSKSDIFVHPTYNDCFPLVLLEAMRNFLPIISTLEGGIPDIVEDGKTGFLVPQKNPRLLAEKIETLIRNPELRYKMSLAGRAKYEKEFTIDKFEGRLVGILTKIIT